MKAIEQFKKMIGNIRLPFSLINRDVKSYDSYVDLRMIYRMRKFDPIASNRDF